MSDHGDLIRWTENLVERTKTEVVPPDSRESFQCLRCGSCCRNNAHALLLDALDAYYLMKRFWQGDQTTTIRTLQKEYLLDQPVAESIPYPCLLVRTRGRKDKCVFLQHGGCSIYEDRPMVCRTYPFYIHVEDGEEIFSLSREREHHLIGESRTVREWTSDVVNGVDWEFLRRKDEHMDRFLPVYAQLTPKQMDQAYPLILALENFSFDVNHPFLPQYIANTRVLYHMISRRQFR